MIKRITMTNQCLFYLITGQMKINQTVEIELIKEALSFIKTSSYP